MIQYCISRLYAYTAVHEFQLWAITCKHESFKNVGLSD